MIERAREYYSGFGFQGIIGIVDIYPVGDQRMMIAADLGQNILWAEVLPGPGHGLTEQGAFLQSRLYKQVLSTEAQEKAERMQETNPQEHAPLIPTFICNRHAEGKCSIAIASPANKHHSVLIKGTVLADGQLNWNQSFYTIHGENWTAAYVLLCKEPAIAVADLESDLFYYLKMCDMDGGGLGEGDASTPAPDEFIPDMEEVWYKVFKIRNVVGRK